MDDRRVADYFLVAGLPENPQPLEEFSNEAAIKPTYKQDPITEITVINKSLGEKVPKGYQFLDKTPSGYAADLNHGSIRCPEMYICYRRSRDKPPLTDVGVLFEGKERLLAGCEVIHTTYFGTPANVNNSNNGRTYVTYRRAAENAPSDMLAVVDLCVILENKDESPPHSYCQISKNLNRGLVGSDVYLCYKKAMTKTDILTYKPAILDRYPKEDYENFILPESVPMFCLPMGATIECWSAKAQHPLPVFSTFILTLIDGSKVYGAAITFYEEFSEEKLSDAQMRNLGLKNKGIRDQYRIMKTVHSNKSVCLLSHWPFFDAFKKILQYIHRISTTGPHEVPIERHISHFMFDVPYPSPQRPRILVQLKHDSLSLSMPEDSPLPQSGASFITMLKNLGPENCMTILLYVLQEHKILIHSLRPAVLTSVAEAVCSLIFPLQWQCPYIPLCPLGLSDMLNAPTPYIIGLDSRYFDLFDPPPDVICIDLDTVRIWPPADKKYISYKLLPKKPTKVLQESLHKLYDCLSQELPYHGHDDSTLEIFDQDFKKKHREIVLELQIQETFLRFMACIMKGYKQYLKPIWNAPDQDTTNATSLFDMTGFIKSRERATQKFFQTLLRTQLFIRFIEDRSFVSDQDDSLAFFDECTEKVDETKDEPKLIEFDDSSKSERTMFILPPEPVGLPEGKTYSYNGFPSLQPDLFLEKNKPKNSTSQNNGKTPLHSPVARRSKQEIKTARKLAQQYLTEPDKWAKCLLGHCYSLWFMILPAYVKQSHSAIKALGMAYDVLKGMQKHKLNVYDEICYRVLLQLCCKYNQPVLAVKVYSEMKHLGVQLNAVTYGYYNKAVLEGKWPSSIGKGRILWRKVRNVIIGVAKFRKALRRRSISVCSNSGSEYDQVSRTSCDSCLEGEKAEVKHDPIMKSGITLEISNPSAVTKYKGKVTDDAERAVLDRGYDSMTREEAKDFSEFLSEDIKEQEARFKIDMKSALRFSFRRNANRKNKDIKEESTDEVSTRVANMASITDQFRSHIGSIVRKRTSSGNSVQDTLNGMLVGSSAGLLMVSELLVSGSLSKNKSAFLGNTTVDRTRKRHRSAGDHNANTRSNSLQLSWINKNPIGQSDFTTKEHSQDILETDENHFVLNTDIMNMNEDIKDSGVGLDENEHYLKNLNTDRLCANHKDGFVEMTVDSNAMCTIKSDSTEKQTTIEEEITDNVDNNSSKSNLKVVIVSPVHVIAATPVTENDPLGLFVDGLQEKIQIHRPNNASRAFLKDKFVPQRPFESEVKPKINIEHLDVKKINIPPPSSNKDYNNIFEKLHPLQVKESVLKTIERTCSFPDNLGNTRTRSIPLGKTDKNTSGLAALGLSSSSLHNSRTESLPTNSLLPDTRLFRTGSFRTRKEHLSGMIKNYTEVVANKLSVGLLKLSMTAGISGSNTSLTQSQEDLDSEDDSYREATRKRSLNLHTNSNDDLDVVDGTKESVPVHPSFMDKIDRLYKEERCRAHHPGEEVQEKIKDNAMEVEMCSCSRCPKCHCLLYDEEIMAGWNADDSNLITRCQFCNNKLVPHLLIYIKDLRGKKKSKLTNIDEDANVPDTIDSPKRPQSQNGYGKDADICPSDSQDSHLTAQEDVDNENLDIHQDPLMQLRTHMPSEARNVVARTQNSSNSSDMAFAGRHKRTASECLTSATENTYSSSVESFESFVTSKNQRSPLNISNDEVDSLPSSPSQTPKHRKALFDRCLLPVESVSVPYLSPLVLRKNLETVVGNEGNLSLAVATFVDEHPILYWNLVWYFKRICALSHLPGLLLISKSYNREAVGPVDYTCDNVLIRLMWDNIRIHQEFGVPMYLAWGEGRSSTTVDALITEARPFSRGVMHQVINNIQCNDVLQPIKLLMNGRRRLRHARGKRFQNLYREILFLSFVACGKENIDPDAFDREYKLAFDRLSQGELRNLQRDDKPRSPTVQYCRKVFGKLEI